MNASPRVSAIIVFYNAEEFVSEAIESVFAQTYPSWELLLVDDGSTDGSTLIARQWQQKFPQRVRYLEHENHINRGISASRNLGMEHAAGEFIAMLDADDVWIPEKLAQQVQLLDTMPDVAALNGRTQYWCTWESPEDTRATDTLPDLGVALDRTYEGTSLLPGLLAEQWMGASMSSLCFRASVLPTVGGFEDEFAGMFEDTVFQVKLFLRERIFISSAVWDRYRRHSRSCTAVAETLGAVRSARHTFLLWVERYFRAHGIDKGPLWRTVQRELWPYRHPHIGRLVVAALSRYRSLKRKVRGPMRPSSKIFPRAAEI